MLMLEKRLTVAEVAEKVGKTEDTVRRWIRQKRIKATRPGGREWYIAEEEVERFIRASQNM